MRNRNLLSPAALWLCAGLLLGGACTSAHADLWNFFMESTGQDASWVSPTRLDTHFPQYAYAYTLTQVEVRLDFGIFGEQWQDASDQIPPEDTSGSGTFGALPQDFINETIGEPGILVADVHVGIDATGQGFAQLSNVSFGSLLGLPLTGVRVGGNIEVQGIPEPATACLLGLGLCALARRPRTR